MPVPVCPSFSYYYFIDLNYVPKVYFIHFILYIRWTLCQYVKKEEKTFTHWCRQPPASHSRAWIHKPLCTHNVCVCTKNTLADSTTVKEDMRLLMCPWNVGNNIFKLKTNEKRNEENCKYWAEWVSECLAGSFNQFKHFYLFSVGVYHAMRAHRIATINTKEQIK